MRHDQQTTPFDVEAEELTQQFWGSSKGWISSEQPTVRTDARAKRRPGRGDDTTGSMRAIRDGVAAFRPQTSANATSEIRRVRQHGAPSHDHAAPALDEPTYARRRADELAADRRREATLGELAAGRSDVGGWFDDDDLDAPIPVRPAAARRTGPDRPASDRRTPDFDEPEYDVPLSPVQPLVDRLGLGAVDPLLVRAGMAALALILLVPLMLSLRPDRGDDTLPGDVVESPQPAVGAAPAAVDPVPSSESIVVTTTLAPSSETVATAAAVTEVAAAAPDVTDRSLVENDPAEPSTTAAADAAEVDVAAERVVPSCPQTYTAAAGDSWYRIADGAGVTPDALLAENNATLESVILPGDDICLPAGASMPTPPTTAPATTAPPATAVPTTAAPATTAPVTTIAPVANLSRTEVQELIRQTWPEDEVDTALAIARRESNFIATADNGSCCVGVFQLYWTVHRNWLDDFGITQRSDLYDARKNIAAAYHMWQTQGWGPWGG